MPEPLSPRLLQATESFQRKYQNPVFGRLPKPMLGPLLEMDLDRVRRGQFPLSTRETAQALAAISKPGQIVPTPPPERGGLLGFIGDIGSDIRHIAMGVPKLPGLAVQELRELPQIGQAIQESGGDITKIAQAPGIRLLPGAFIAANLKTPGQLAEHPLLTLLDVLPAGEGLARLTPRYKALAAEAKAADRLPPRALRALTKETVGPPVAQAVRRATGRTPGEMLERFGLGRQARDINALREVRQREMQRQAVEFHTRISDMARRAGITNADRAVEVTGIIERGDPTDLSKLSPSEQRLVEEYRGLQDEFSQRGIDTGELIEVGDEVFPRVEGKRLLSLERQLQAKSLNQALEAKQAKITRLAPSLEAARVASQVFDQREISRIANEIAEDTRLGPSEVPRRAVRSEHALRGKVWEAANSPGQRAMKFLAGGNYAKAAQELRRAAVKLDAAPVSLRGWERLGRAGVYREYADVLDAQERALGAIRTGEQASQVVGRLRNEVNEAQARRASLERELARTKGRTVPRRFQPLVREEFTKRAKQKLRDKAITTEQLKLYLDYASDGLFDLIPVVARKDLTTLWNEVAPKWEKFKELGYDPAYLHVVDVGQVAGLRFPRIYPEVIRKPSQVRARAFDASPGVKNFEVALKSQHLEWLRYEANREVVDTVVERYGKRREQLYEEYLPAARAQMQHLPPGVDVRSVIEGLMERDGWVHWSPESVVPWMRPRATLHATPAEVFVPNHIQSTLQGMYPKGRPTGFKGIFDTANQVFRITILPLSPRWHLYNVLGGGIMTAARTSPLAIVRYFDQARRMVQDGEVDSRIAQGMGSVPREQAAWSYAAGATFGRWLSESRVSQTARALEPVGTRLASGLEWLFEKNGQVDLFYRSIAYLHGQEKGLRGGLSEAGARNEGVLLANQVLQNWDRMTPFERQIMRSVFPFYGWMKHILSYTMSYPMDHPVRMSITANFVRNEWEDWGEGLPERFFQMFVLGKPDIYGNVNAIQFRGSNPFSDVANYMTLAGFVNQLNPVVGGVLEAMGINPATGRAELYPDLTYDPTTGRVVPKGRNILTTIVGGMVPQAEAVATIFGVGPDEMRALAINNPEAYRSRIASGLGLPPLPQQVNLAREAGLAELARDRAARESLRNALKTGSWGDAMRYPSNRPILRMIRDLPPEQLEQFRLPERSYIRE